MNAWIFVCLLSNEVFSQFKFWFVLFCLYSFHLIDYWYMYYNSNDLHFCYRDQERKVGPDGFLDSNRYSHSFLLKKDATGRRRAASVAGQPSVVSLTSRIHQDKKDYDRRIKVIEVHKYACSFFFNWKRIENCLFNWEHLWHDPGTVAISISRGSIFSNFEWL